MLRLKHDLEPGRMAVGELIEPCGRGRLAPRRSSASNPELCGEKSRASRPRPPIHSQSHGPGERIDDVVVTYFAKPHSYTTDDIIEISAHGSPVVLRHVVELALARGARLAEPGEFTMRAFLNGRIDLTQAEAVRDLIESQTLLSGEGRSPATGGCTLAPPAPDQTEAGGTDRAARSRDRFRRGRYLGRPAEEILQHISAVRAPLEELSNSFAYGKLVHQGLTLAIVGRPNVGKSSLFNRLVEHDRAIVTATPGTTRDLVTETVALDGIPVKLVDTAGIRSSVDEAESIGIGKSIEALADADLVLVVLDSSQAVEEEDRRLLGMVEQRPAILVENKGDIISSQFVAPASRLRRVRVSALTSEGITELRAEILQHVGGEHGGRSETGFLTNARHQGLVTDSLVALDATVVAVKDQVPHEMVLLDLYNALRPLDEITGATSNDDILNLIFSRFCIGK